MQHFEIWQFIQRAADFGRTEATETLMRILQDAGVPTAAFEAARRSVVGPRTPASPEHVEAMHKLARYCRERELLNTADFIDRMAVAASKAAEDMVPMMPELQRRWEDEFKRIVLFHMPHWQAQLYERDKLFGEQVWHNFPSARDDVREAGSCLATDRATACVFHLMRAIESPLAILKARFGIRTKSDNWDQILRPIDKKLKETNFRRRPWWKKDEQFYGEVSNRLHALKLSRRNAAIHLRPDERFEVPVAAVVCNDVRAFLQHLATKLKARGVP